MPWEQSETRVSRRADGWYEAEGGVVLPLLQDVYLRGRPGVLDTLLDMRRRVEDLERRG